MRAEELLLGSLQGDPQNSTSGCALLGWLGGSIQRMAWTFVDEDFVGKRACLTGMLKVDFSQKNGPHIFGCPVRLTVMLKVFFQTNASGISGSPERLGGVPRLFF